MSFWTMLLPIIEALLASLFKIPTPTPTPAPTPVPPTPVLMPAHIVAKLNEAGLGCLCDSHSLATESGRQALTTFHAIAVHGAAIEAEINAKTAS